MGQDDRADRRAARRSRQQQPSIREQDPALVLAKLALMVEDSDRETVVSSGEDSGVDAKDWIRGLAQRATEPDFKYRVAKGPFVFVKPAFKTGRHFYANEELQRLQDGEAEARLRGGLKGKQFAVKGVLNFDRRGQPDTFTVEDVAQIRNQPDAATLLAQQQQQQEKILAAIAAGEQKMLTDAARAAAGALQVVQAADAAVGRVVTAAAAAIQPQVAGMPAPVLVVNACGNSAAAAFPPPVAPVLQAPVLGEEAGIAAAVGSKEATAPDRPRRRRERHHHDDDGGHSGRHNVQEQTDAAPAAQRPGRQDRQRAASRERQGHGERVRRRRSRHADGSRPRPKHQQGQEVERRQDRRWRSREDVGRRKNREDDGSHPRPSKPHRSVIEPPRARDVAVRENDDRGSNQGSQHSSLLSVEKTEKPARKAYNARDQAVKQTDIGSEESGRADGEAGWDLTDSEQGPEVEERSTVTATARPTDPRTRIRERKAQVWSTSEEDEETVLARRTARAEQRMHENTTKDEDEDEVGSEVRGKGRAQCSNASGSEEDVPLERKPMGRKPSIPTDRPVAAIKGDANTGATMSPQKPKLITSAHSTDSEDGVRPAGKVAARPSRPALGGKAGPPGKSTAAPPRKCSDDDDDSY